MPTRLGRRLVESLYPRRIDAAVLAGSGWWVLECKGFVNHHALGQALTYGYLWLRDCPGCRLDGVTVICEWCDPDVRELMGHLGVGLVELEVAGRRGVTQ